jgi:betaine reductase
MPSVAVGVGANRIVAGAAITTPLGSPSLSAEAERQFRRELVMKGLELLTQKIEEPTVLTSEG